MKGFIRAPSNGIHHLSKANTLGTQIPRKMELCQDFGCRIDSIDHFMGIVIGTSLLVMFFTIELVILVYSDQILDRVL